MKRSQQLLALAPLLGGTDLLVKSLALGLLGLLIQLLCGLALAPLRRHLAQPALALAGLLLGAVLVGASGLLLQALSAELAASLAVFLPLLMLPCLGLALEHSHNPWIGLRPGLLFLALALLLGGLREALGHGSLLVHADWLFGPTVTGWQWSTGIPLLTHAAGAFILLGLLLAALHHFNHDDAR